MVAVEPTQHKGIRMKVQVEKGIEWMEQVGRNLHLGVDRLTHQFAVGFDTPGGRIPIMLTACDLQRLGVEAIRLTGRYAVFDFSSSIPEQPANGIGELPHQADRPR